MKKNTPEIVLSTAQLMAIEYLANPEHHALSLKEIASLVGVSHDALYQWRKKPVFMRHLQLIRHTIFDNYRKKIDNKLFEMAANGNIQAIKLYYRLAGLGPVRWDELMPPEGIKIIIEHPPASEATISDKPRSAS